LTRALTLTPFGQS